MASEGPTPRAQAKQDQIRAGAQRLFLKNGFAGTSTDAIAAEAGVSKQTLYAYYPSKEDLLADVLRRLISDIPQSWPPPTTGEPSLGSREHLRLALTELARGMIASLMQPEYVSLVRVIIAETPRFPHLGVLFRTTVPERALGTISTLLKHARERGMAEVEDVDAAARMFAGSLLTYVLLDGLFVGDGPPRPPAPERIEEVVGLFMKVVS